MTGTDSLNRRVVAGSEPAALAAFDFVRAALRDHSGRTAPPRAVPLPDPNIL